MLADAPYARRIAGRMNWLMCCQGACVNGVNCSGGAREPDGGEHDDHGRFPEPGADNDRQAARRIILHSVLPDRGQHPDGQRPAGPKTIAMAPSSKLTGSRRAISSSTGRFVHNDSPRLPWTTWLSQIPYCVDRLVEPELGPQSLQVFCVGFSSNINTTTSPGIRRVRENTMIDE